jgi:hypothetical protein
VRRNTVPVIIASSPSCSEICSMLIIAVMLRKVKHRIVVSGIDFYNENCKYFNQKTL